jgi:hypothetical protein
MTSQFKHFCPSPLRQQASVHQQDRLIGQGFRPNQRLAGQPIQQIHPVRRGEDRVQRVTAFGGGNTDGSGKQVQVVIA